LLRQQSISTSAGFGDLVVGMEGTERLVLKEGAGVEKCSDAIPFGLRRSSCCQ